MTCGMFTPRSHPEMRCAQHYTLNQKSDSRENPFSSMRMSKIRHQYAILTPSWLVPPALLTFKRHLPVTKADVVLTFCTY